MPVRAKWTKRKRAAFLDVVRATGNVSAGARAADMSRAQVYSLGRRDADFRADWDSALLEALDDLEGALRRRAVEGVEKSVYYGGKRCGSNVSYSDNLGMFLLRARRKDIFGDGKAEERDDVPSAVNAAGATAGQRLLAKLLEISEQGRPGSGYLGESDESE